MTCKTGATQTKEEHIGYAIGVNGLSFVNIGVKNMSNATKIRNAQAKAKAKARERAYTVSTVDVVTAVMILTLHSCYGFGDKRLGTVMESMHALMQEHADKRTTPSDLIQWALEETGIDARKVWGE